MSLNLKLLNVIFHFNQFKRYLVDRSVSLYLMTLRHLSNPPFDGTTGRLVDPLSLFTSQYQGCTDDCTGTKSCVRKTLKHFL